MRSLSNWTLVNGAANSEWPGILLESEKDQSVLTSTQSGLVSMLGTCSSRHLEREGSTVAQGRVTPGRGLSLGPVYLTALTGISSTRQHI
jgi:hypothetical protein